MIQIRYVSITSDADDLALTGVDRTCCDGAYDGDAGDGVGSAHERRVKLRGHLGDEFDSEETCDYEDEDQQHDGLNIHDQASLNLS